MIRGRTRWFGYVPLMIATLAVGVIPPVPASATPVPSAPVSPAVVLVNQPVRSVCVGRKFTVGVWYQQSGGSRAYRVAVYNPRGTRIFYRRGRAPSAHWRLWKIRARRVGKYRTVYSGHWKKPTVWTRYRANTRARRC